ncbi:expressed unknown protein [Seminavis robusta]|uniref:Uncharacterized protein n=1 Tax=Seminavis robusta TaxID=568900 RepID=A0A9N8E1F8_9STRA|nr:expressed unknown protein [Seminavis robusta]|eukprot:Sro437_g142920.1 n/a (170) ;mRNA; r:58403-58912
MHRVHTHLARTARLASRARSVRISLAVISDPSSTSSRITSNSCSRSFATDKKPDWMIEAELEAIAATNARAIKQGTANDVVMGKLKHELDREIISNAIKLEEKLVMIIQKCNDAKSGAMVDARGRAVYNALRKKALATRQDLITQKEAAGMVTDATSMVESAHPIPASM